ncbi:MAG: hypothetical protein MJ016_08465 [Victivallaceae bacterium]|nr:hypothetical protein [Victivallaceae bacterium]
MEITEELGNGNLRILVPIKICNIRNRRLIVLPGTETETLAASPLLIGIANALRLALLSPEIVHKALTGDLSVNAKSLMFGNIPADARGAEARGGDIKSPGFYTGAGLQMIQMVSFEVGQMSSDEQSM